MIIIAVRGGVLCHVVWLLYIVCVDVDQRGWHAVGDRRPLTPAVRQIDARVPVAKAALSCQGAPEPHLSTIILKGGAFQALVGNCT